MADKGNSRADQIRALREAKFARKGSGERTDEALAREVPSVVGARVQHLRTTANTTARENDQAGMGSERSSLIRSKRGRPRIGEVRDKPWIAAGMSERTWYRRKAEKK